MSTQGLSFALPARPAATRIRGCDTATLRAATGARTMPMAGFDTTYRDIVDYIVRITEEIWSDRAIGRIYGTYAADCRVYTSLNTTTSVAEVITSTTQSLNAQPDHATYHINVAWSGDERDFYTSHLGFARTRNVGDTLYGPATGRRYGIHFIADCVSRANMIHTEWLVRDNLSLVRQLGFDPLTTAQRLADARGERPSPLPDLAAPGVAPFDGPRDTLEGFFAHHFHDIWNRRMLDHVAAHYAPDATIHWPGGVTGRGHDAIQRCLLSLFAALPNAFVAVQHLSWSEEADGVIVAIRWQLEGTSASAGLLAGAAEGKPVRLIGMTHLRFRGDKIVEEWTMFDGMAALIQAFAA